jgi:hypothetical protein
MKPVVLFCFSLCFLIAACVSRDHPPVGTYLDPTGEQSVIVSRDALEMTVLSRVFAEKEPRVLNLRLTYSVAKNGEIRLMGSSNSKAYLSISTLYKWRFEAGQIVREDVDSGATTIFRKRG